ncbi:MAG TPA: efflux RND transporter periplasmic adaptor subunit [Rhodanobacteraceae bacterium]|nr:efflux RND transporter periplasmic adaptor subunit [Rhodanobacteraceae bacterium]
MTQRRGVRPARFGASLVLAALLAACGTPQQPLAPPPAPPLETFVVSPQQSAREQTWDGVVEAVDATTIAAQTNARVLELPVDVGDRVRKGDVLVRFSDVEQQSGRRAAEANVVAARAEYRNAEINWKRAQALLPSGAISRAQLDDATARRDAARAASNAAEAALRAAGQQTDYTVLRAPFDGVITQRFVHVGEAVQSGPPTPQPLIALAALDALRVDVVVPQGAVDAIRASQHASVVLDDGTRVQAAKMTVFPYADPATHSFRVRVELPAGGSGLYPGMTVKVAFAIGAATRLLVPVDALVRRGELSAVYVIAADHSVGLRQVRLGYRFGSEVEILAGLATGDRVARDPGAAALYLTSRHSRNASP